METVAVQVPVRGCICYPNGAFRLCLFSCISSCNIASADACFMAHESRISCSMLSPIQTLLRGTCRMPLETLQCAAVAAATIKSEHKKKCYSKRCMASFLERRKWNLNYLGEERMDSWALFRNFTRMTASDFELLLQLIGPSIKKKQDTNPNKHAFSCDLAFFSHWWLVSYSHVYTSYSSASSIDHHTRCVPSCHKVTETVCGGK